MDMPESRPSEITLLVTLQAIGAAGWVLIGALAVMGGGAAGVFAPISAIVVGAGIMLILKGATDLAVTYWLWKGRTWARTVCIALAAISIALTVPSIMTGVGLVRLLVAYRSVYNDRCWPRPATRRCAHTLHFDEA